MAFGENYFRGQVLLWVFRPAPPTRSQTPPPPVAAATRLRWGQSRRWRSGSGRAVAAVPGKSGGWPLRISSESKSPQPRKSFGEWALRIISEGNSPQPRQNSFGRKSFEGWPLGELCQRASLLRSEKVLEDILSSRRHPGASFRSSRLHPGESFGRISSRSQPLKCFEG